jgi:hypothetical protein
LLPLFLAAAALAAAAEFVAAYLVCTASAIEIVLLQLVGHYT